MTWTLIAALIIIALSCLIVCFLTTIAREIEQIMHRPEQVKQRKFCAISGEPVVGIPDQIVIKSSRSTFVLSVLRCHLHDLLQGCQLQVESPKPGYRQSLHFILEEIKEGSKEAAFLDLLYRRLPNDPNCIQIKWAMRNLGDTQ